MPLTSVGMDGMRFVHREIVGHTVDLARAGEDDFGVGITPSTGFENRELSTAIDLEIGEGVLHAIDMADLSGQIEYQRLIAD